MGFHSELMGFHSEFMGFHSELMFNGGVYRRFFLVKVLFANLNRCIIAMGMGRGFKMKPRDDCSSGKMIF